MKPSPRKLFCAVAAISLTAGGTALLFTGCEGLDYSARGEGTGVQIIGAIVVLARYHASAHQKEVAEHQARAVFVASAKPEYVKRRATVQTTYRKKQEAVEQDYNKRISTAKPKPAHVVTAPGSKPAPPAQTGGDEHRLKQEKEKSLARLHADEASEMASVDTAWRSLGGTADYSVKTAGDSAPSGSVPTASTRDREALVASASAHMPGYIAVSVPAQGIAAEQGGKATIMLWDTRRQRLASEDVLVLDRKPAMGQDVKVEGVTARLAGNP